MTAVAECARVPVMDPYSQGTGWALYNGDCLAVCEALAAKGVVADALVTDPPAGIGFMGKDWDGAKGGRDKWVAWLAARLGAARAVTRPGGRALVWSIPRTSHWAGTAVEDAGWSMETHVLHLFGQGFPKAKSQLKPAHEPWWLARNGRSEALNIDAARVGTTKRVPGGTSTFRAAQPVYGGFNPAPADASGHDPHVGRYPPTLVLSHTPWCAHLGRTAVRSNSTLVNAGEAPACGLKARTGALGYADLDGTEEVELWDCVEGCPVALVGEASGTSQSSDRVRRNTVEAFNHNRTMGDGWKGVETRGYADEGTAARFFPQFPADQPEPIVGYFPKISTAERFAFVACGCGERVLPLKEAEGLVVRVPAPTEKDAERVRMTCKVCALDVRHHVHPTQKPIELMRWLIRLVTQPGDLVLDLFSGSGSTAVAALLEGRRFVGAELDPEYAATITERLRRVAP